MSSTNRGAERRPDDFYETPAWCVRRILERVAIPCDSGHVWLDAGAGSGALVQAALDSGVRAEWLAIEKAPRVPVLCGWYGRWLGDTDFLGPVALKAIRQKPPTAAICNPPFSLAYEFVARLVAEVPISIVLLRLAWLASEKRAAFLHDHMPDVYVLPNRPSFTGNGTDSADYAWMVWDRRRERRAGVEVLATTPRSERCP